MPRIAPPTRAPTELPMPPTARAMKPDRPSAVPSAKSAKVSWPPTKPDSAPSTPART